jgi:hypothetical protein
VSSHPLEPEVTKLVTPTRTLVLRAKRATLRLLADGLSHRTTGIVHAVLEAEGASRDFSGGRIITFPDPGPQTLTRDTPAIAQARGQLAAYQALAELAAESLVVPSLERDEQDEPRVGQIESPRLTFSVRTSGGSTNLFVYASVPAVASAYRLLDPDAADRWYLEPDLFLDELKNLGLDKRVARTLREALAAYRRGLYLASASLLGVVFEAAWYAGAVRVGPTGQLTDAISGGRTAKVQELVTDRLRQRLSASDPRPAELHSHAALMRAIRNYGSTRPRERTPRSIGTSMKLGAGC